MAYKNYDEVSHLSKNHEFINNRSALGIRLGLENIGILMEELGSIHLGQKYIHIAGTNGKGSVASFIAKALEMSGFRVGKYTSPKISDLNDMISINGDFISDAKLQLLSGRLQKISDKLEAKGVMLTEFELTTALALLYFYEEDCDYSVIEVGLGGATDATNIITPLISVITPISIDHSNILGGSLSEIAEVKSGIIKRAVPVCMGFQTEEVREIIKSKAVNMDAPCYELKREDIEPISMSLEETEFRYKSCNYSLTQPGTYQIENAALALLSLYVVRQKYDIDLTDEVIREALRRTKWNFRFELYSKSPAILLDGAHNPDGIRALRDSLEVYFKDKKLRAVFGVMRDKAVRSMLRDIAYLFDEFLLPEISPVRAMPNTEIRDILTELGYEGKIKLFSDFEGLTDEIYSGDDAVIAFGSLYYLEELRKNLR